MAKKNAIRLHLHKVAAGDATDKLYYPDNESVQQGQRHHITLLSFEDEDHTPVEIQVNVKKVTTTFKICEELTATAGVLYWWQYEIVLTEGERLELYFLTATAADNLHAWIQGYWVRESEEVVA